ncbi:hypothetical protein SAMN05660226_01374 [Parapedobacter luteus]|uniref:Haloalkane dehalogenase n=2 Tax=Parapedobacter luteus TaxID=623280 RepID=A0A1T5BDC3_9SPHI|nr:hypothetical protein SAMN05660226_01374 [Parapedobacter luteus]
MYIMLCFHRKAPAHLARRFIYTPPGMEKQPGDTPCCICSTVQSKPVAGQDTAVWGNKDPFFLPPGAEAYKRDIPDAIVKFYDTGHFALETHAAEIGADILKFLDSLS